MLAVSLIPGGWFASGNIKRWCGTWMSRHVFPEMGLRKLQQQYDLDLRLGFVGHSDDDLDLLGDLQLPAENLLGESTDLNDLEKNKAHLFSDLRQM